MSVTWQEAAEQALNAREPGEPFSLKVFTCRTEEVTDEEFTSTDLGRWLNGRQDVDALGNGVWQRKAATAAKERDDYTVAELRADIRALSTGDATRAAGNVMTVIAGDLLTRLGFELDGKPTLSIEVGGDVQGVRVRWEGQ
jgi:hypothetical protein